MKTSQVSDQLWLFTVQFSPTFSYSSKEEETGFQGMYERRTKEIRKMVDRLGDEEDKHKMEATFADVYIQ